jgi:hypothetical protein
MPSEYECDECGLNFTVGWYHYHRFDSGYGGRTLLVCTSCGTVHSLEHPVRDASVQERLQVQAGPVVRPQKVDGRLTVYGDWLGNDETGGKKIKELTCMHCARAGTLRKDWPLLGGPCPKCGTKIRRPRESWMT